MKAFERPTYHREHFATAATLPLLGTLSYMFTPTSDGAASAGAQIGVTGKIGAFGSSPTEYGSA